MSNTQVGRAMSTAHLDSNCTVDITSVATSAQNRIIKLEDRCIGAVVPRPLAILDFYVMEMAANKASPSK